MSYNDNLLLGIQFAYVLLGFCTATVIGSIGFGIWLFLNKGTAKFYVRDAMKFLKLILASFLIPILPFVLFPVIKSLGGVAGTYMVKAMLNILFVVLIIWVLFVLVMFGIRVYKYVLVCKMCRDNIPIEDETIQKELVYWKEKLHIHNKVQVYMNANVSSPAILYHWGYKVLLPAMELTDEEISMAMLHELVHLKHRDLWTKDICFFIQIIHGINPFMWRMKREVIRWAEVLCDLTTCEVGKERFSRQAYYYSIRHLMQNAENEMKNDALFSLCESKSLLEFRVDMFAESNKDNQKRLKGIFRVVLILMLTTTFLIYGAATATANIWYEASLTEHQEEQVEDIQWYTATCDRMMSDAVVVDREEIDGASTIEKRVVLKKNEMIVFDLQNISGITVYIFGGNKEYIIGKIVDEKQIHYTENTGAVTQRFIVKDNEKTIFLQNPQNEELTFEICITAEN